MVRTKSDDWKLELQRKKFESEKCLQKMLNVNLDELWIYLHVLLCEFSNKYNQTIAGTTANHRHKFEQFMDDIVKSLNVKHILKTVLCLSHVFNFLFAFFLFSYKLNYFFVVCVCVCVCWLLIA